MGIGIWSAPAHRPTPTSPHSSSAVLLQARIRGYDKPAAGGLTAQSFNVLVQVRLSPSRLRAPVSHATTSLSRRTVMKSAGARLLKKVSEFVLSRLPTSTYRKGTPRRSNSLRPCHRTFLSSPEEKDQRHNPACSACSIFPLAEKSAPHNFAGTADHGSYQSRRYTRVNRNKK